MKKIAVIISHPVQYYAPVFALLAKNSRFAVKVFYTMGDSSRLKYDRGFKKEIIWDIPLLQGYEYEFLKNEATDPGSHHFMGIINPDAIQRIEKYKPDAVLIYGWGFFSHLKIILHFSKTLPVWFRGDSTLLDLTGRLKSVLRSVFLKWVYKHIDKAFYVGSANKDYFLKYGLKPGQLYFAPHGVDNDRFAAEHPVDALSLRRELNIADDQILILFAGKFEAKKAPLELLQAFKSLGKTNTHLLFLGNGVLEQQLKDKAEGESNIHFHDFVNQSEIPVFYQACDLFCLPSKGPGETWGLAVNEAMAAGKAILVSDKVGCAKDLVKDEWNGLIINMSVESDLRNGISRLTDNKAALIKMGQRSVEIIDQYSIEKQIKVIEEQVFNL